MRPCSVRPNPARFGAQTARIGADCPHVEIFPAQLSLVIRLAHAIFFHRSNHAESTRNPSLTQSWGKETSRPAAATRAAARARWKKIECLQKRGTSASEKRHECLQKRDTSAFKKEARVPPK